ncbi:HNH endonuclease signature motif containing protein [Paraburkholderia strydomiana]|uniref:HNH endonuclease n=1 Tax=Paraburkholderia strydomiana TaxID=1245417 RepID=UPI0038B95E5B
MARKLAEPWYHAPPAEEICPLCGRPIPPSQRDLHHWEPKTKGGKEVAALHRICHRQLHALFSETELAQRFSTVNALLTDEAVRNFVRWVRTKPNDFYERSRRSARKG